MTDSFLRLDRADAAKKIDADFVNVGGVDVYRLRVAMVGAAGGGGAATIADGADVAQGSLADAAWVSGNGTVISLLKKIASAGGSAVSIADGADVAQGTTTDLSSASTVVGLLKNLKAALAGTLAVNVGLTDAQLRAAPVPISTTLLQALTDVQLRASAVPVSGPLTDVQLRASAVPISGNVGVLGAVEVVNDVGNPLPVSGTVTVNVGLTDTQLRALAVPISAAALPLPAGASTEATLALIKAKTDNLDVLLSTRTKPADSQLADVSDRVARILGVITAANLDVALSTRLKPADTLAAVTAITNVVHVDDNAGSLTVDAPVAVPLFARLSDGAAALTAQKTMALSLPVVIASDQSAVPITAPALTKGTQGANGFSVQDLRDAGRNTRIFMLDAFVAAPVVEAVQSVVQWYGNAAVVGTVSPAVVPAGKILRLTGWRITYRSIATFGSAIVRIRANTAGLGVLASPIIYSFEAGANLGATTVAIVGAVTTETGVFPEGLELPAGTGLAFSMAGYGPTGVLTLEGPTRFAVHGYEY